MLGYSVFDPSVRPFAGLRMLFFSRRVCQALCAQPMPQGMIWRAPGGPSLLVTYGATSDLFLSGHTARSFWINGEDRRGRSSAS